MGTYVIAWEHKLNLLNVSRCYQTNSYVIKVDVGSSPSFGGPSVKVVVGFVTGNTEQ